MDSLFCFIIAVTLICKLVVGFDVTSAACLDGSLNCYCKLKEMLIINICPNMRKNGKFFMILDRKAYVSMLCVFGFIAGERKGRDCEEVRDTDDARSEKR